MYGELFVTGNLQGGKLGLGKAWKQGCILSFTMVPDIPSVTSISCGPNHMAAICEYDIDNYDIKDGSTYCWGKNGKGQLGLGNKEDSNYPRKVHMSKDRFKKIVCGYNFTMGLTINN